MMLRLMASVPVLLLASQVAMATASQYCLNTSEAPALLDNAAKPVAPASAPRWRSADGQSFSLIHSAGARSFNVRDDESGHVLTQPLPRHAGALGSTLDSIFVAASGWIYIDASRGGFAAQIGVQNGQPIVSAIQPLSPLRQIDCSFFGRILGECLAPVSRYIGSLGGVLVTGKLPRWWGFTEPMSVVIKAGSERVLPQAVAMEEGVFDVGASSGALVRGIDGLPYFLDARSMTPLPIRNSQSTDGSARGNLDWSALVTPLKGRGFIAARNVSGEVISLTAIGANGSTTAIRLPRGSLKGPLQAFDVGEGAALVASNDAVALVEADEATLVVRLASGVHFRIGRSVQTDQGPVFGFRLSMPGGATQDMAIRPRVSGRTCDKPLSNQSTVIGAN